MRPYLLSSIVPLAFMGLLGMAEETPGVVNRPPVFTAVPTASATDLDEQTSIRLSVEAMDPDNDRLTYTWEWKDLTGLGEPVPGTFSDTSVPNPTWTAPDIHRWDREYMLSVTVSDGRGGIAKGAVYIIVFWRDGAPVVGELTGPSLLESGQQGLYTVEAEDPEQDVLWFNWDQLLPAAPLGHFASVGRPEEEEQATMSWTAPTVSEETLFVLHVSVTDDSSPPEERTVFVRVTPPQP
jgi:hypothetical protein